MESLKGLESEAQVRELIEKAGIPTFPRPAGIPDNFLVQITKDGAGMEYINPLNKHCRVRVMPGKQHSEWLFQKDPYIKYMKEGSARDMNGNIVRADMPEAHIPYEKFTYRD